MPLSAAWCRLARRLSHRFQRPISPTFSVLPDKELFLPSTEADGFFQKLGFKPVQGGRDPTSESPFVYISPLRSDGAESRTREGKKLPVDRYRFAPQDHDVRTRRNLYVSKDEELGTVEAIDLAARTIDVKKRRASVDLHPEAVFAQENVPARPIPEALGRLAREVVENDVYAPGRFRAARDLLLGRLPRLGSRFVGELAREDETTRESATRLALELAESVLPVQGPPGTGNTYTSARVVCELVRAGQKVGITGPSHKVIRNLPGRSRQGCRRGASGAPHLAAGPAGYSHRGRTHPGKRQV